MKRFLTLLTLVCLYAGPARAQEQEGEVIRNEFLEIELTMPDDWYDAGSTENRLFLASRGQEDQGYLLISRLPGLGRTLQSCATQTENYAFTKMDGFMDEEKHVEVGGAPGYLQIYQGASKVKENGWRMFYRVICEKNGDFLIFHGVMDKDDFSKHRGTLEKIIKSVSWISSEP